MRIDIMTLFPDAVDAMMDSVHHRPGAGAGLCHHPDAPDPGVYHQQADAGGRLSLRRRPGRRDAGRPAVPLLGSISATRRGTGCTPSTCPPAAACFTQQVARELKAQYDSLILVCGHYEGVDQRFLDECVDEEISMGDFVLTGGEIPAMALADCRVPHGARRAAGGGAAYSDESPTGTGCWSIPSTPARRSGTAARCRRCCSADTTATWPPGGRGRATSAPWRRRPDLWEKFDLTQVHSRHEKKVLAQALEEFRQEQGSAAETEE